MKKIMFNDQFHLTQAVLEGRKTQTRRLITPQPYYNEHKGMVWKGYMYGIKGYNAPYDAYDNFISTLKEFNRLPFNIGEEVAIAQKYSDIENMPFDREFELERGGKPSAGWDNKMFVEAMYMQHHIRITNVRVERLQDISDEDCLAEGIYEAEKDAIGKWVIRYGFDDTKNPYGHWFNTPKEAYASLIDKVGKKGTWESNPYVFVYEFELID